MLADTYDVFECAEPRFYRRAVRCLGIHPYQRLCPARPQQNPAAVLEVELEAVIGADTLDADAGHLLWLVLLEPFKNSLAVGVVGLANQMNVMPRVGVRPDALLEVGKDHRKR